MNTGTKKRSSKNKYIKSKPILLNSWGKDFYTLGIFCQKVNIVAFAYKSLSILRRPSQETKLFEMGMNEADQWTFRDIAFEVYNLRQLTGDRFDAFIYKQAGFRVLSELKKSIADAHDWETEEQKAIGQELLDLNGVARLNMEAMA